MKAVSPAVPWLEKEDRLAYYGSKSLAKKVFLVFKIRKVFYKVRYWVSQRSMRTRMTISRITMK